MSEQQTRTGGKWADVPVLDYRKHGYYRVDNALIDRAGEVIGSTGVAVYNLLARLANNDSLECWPSYDYICQRLSMSKPTAVAALKLLEACQMIAVRLRFANPDGTGPQLPNGYILIDTEEWDLRRGKEFLLRGQEEAKKRGKKSLPRSQKPSPKKDSPTQDSSKKNEQSTTPSDDAGFQNSELNGASKPHDESLVALLVSLRVAPQRAKFLASRYPENAARRAGQWQRRGFDGVNSPGAAVANSIEKADSQWIDELEKQVAPDPPNPRPALLPEQQAQAAQIAERHMRAALAVYETLNTAQRNGIGATPADGPRFAAAVERYCNREFVGALRAQGD